MAADPENCQLCHRYSGLAAFTPESGTKKIFYVNETIYRNTVHGNVQCTHCHKDVKEVPHKPAKKVDCGVKCHVKEPSTDKDFSHKPIVEQFNKGAHGQSKLFRYEDGQPKCKYCHQNPIYQPMRGILAKHRFIKKFYVNFEDDLRDALRYLNPDMDFLPKGIEAIVRDFPSDFQLDEKHKEITDYIESLIRKNETDDLRRYVLRAANLRKFLG